MSVYNEEQIHNDLVESLKSHYEEDSIEKEFVGEDFRADVVLKDEWIAIECKARKAAIKKGIGQCVRYEVNGWSSYLCISEMHFNEKVKQMCMQAGVGLILVSDITKERCKYKVVIQNDIEMEGSYSGTIKTKGSVKPYKLLDMLDMSSLDDLYELQEKLLKSRKVVVDGTKYMDGRRIKTDHSILPET